MQVKTGLLNSENNLRNSADRDNTSLLSLFLCSTSIASKTIESYLEIPLDSAVTKGLKKIAKRGELPQWKGLKSLTKAVSAKYQQFALK